MREIKFRAWDVENKKMIQSYAHLSKWGQFYTTWTSTDSEREYIPMQYTGLKDKNGKEIYEGDIIESTWNGEKYLIEWDELNGEWCFCSDTNETGGKYKGSIVIGNKYENPDLREFFGEDENNFK